MATSDISSSNERHYYAKLEAIKDIRDKTLALEKLKLKIVKEVKISDDEEKCLDEYRKEMEHLLEEKMSHVEELRQIHADINDMENIIKQTKENQTRSVDMANRVYEEYLALKYQIDHMRRDYLGLSPLRELHEEEGSPISKDRFQTNFLKVSAAAAAAVAAAQPTSLARPHPRHPLIPETTVTALAPTGGVSGPTGGHAFMPPAPPGSGSAAAAGAAVRLGKSDFSAPPLPPPPTSRLQQAPSIGIGHHPSFRSDFNVNLRQQPPPMKSCLSCHQQIHRNAPICPLCKAKSRSRNPKKPKKKNN
ncbi:zinc finger C4H2 domain-containing protein [Rhagoletis pomonella]|uniref:zinc finger C4H2 domain-containing protein n=1 Tax=Rhagoletis pomonella TaxID=28610 RepID=UPI00177D14AB|nr:zinc finger C4H2 domain-containing protein [Rhagoletis pomonella]XP_036318689.1 zinc finger C4H2 domain-containing protein [Rhagoletis pomonella]